ncbi:prostatic acid phosphatase isoform X2 [Battus philenor]|uniref:prostatic acid phosphatase isoform X2 n=1 Tax=Battus philenor TaxID=42288 RepID=UPI0035CE972F
MFLFLFLFTFLTESFGELTIKYAAVIYRHGERTPIDPYPTDPYRNESLWPVRFGELTNIGKQQHYKLGKWLRARYSNLISNEFDPKEIYVRSTDVDRTLMSAQANLAGMYPPKGEAVWNNNLLWQPIPIHTKPEKDDEVLAMKKSCIAYNKEKQQYKQSKKYKERLSKYQNLMDYLTVYTGIKIKDYEDMEDVYSNLYIETLYNFTLPNWTQSIFPQKLKEPSCYSFTTSTATPLMARLMVGPLLKDIVNKMLLSISNSPSQALKMSIYSGHDFTISNILSAMDLFDGNCPPFTATIIMELLYDNVASSYYIRVLYRNTTEIVEPNTLFIPYCGESCPIERFMKLYDNLLSVDWEYECEKKVIG